MSSNCSVEFAPVVGNEGFPKIVLVADDGARAEIYLHGGQVTSWTPAGDTVDRLFLSSRAHFKAGGAIRGGVPVSFPQFAGQGTLPNHGFARVSTWDVVRAGRLQSGAAQAILRLVDSQATRSLWAHAFVAELTVSLAGRELGIGLVVRNAGSTTFEFTGALHTYLRVADVGQVAIRGLRNVHYRDKVLGEDDVVEAASELKIDRPIDRIYFAAPDKVEVHESGRTIVSHATGFPDTVVWNPGERGGAALDDLEPGGYARMVCIEAAVARTPAELNPGETWSGAQRLIASSEK
jgi:glucose-6-phosphate 1-epimerase